MKLIKPSFEILESQGYLKDIEIAGRHCYKSEGKITPDSAKEFVERMIKSKHCAMLEHGTVYLTMDVRKDSLDVRKYYNNKYSKVNGEGTIRKYHVTTNYRVLVENNWLDDLQYLCEPTEYHEKRTTVKFILDRGISHEFVRHKILCAA